MAKTTIDWTNADLVANTIETWLEVFDDQVEQWLMLVGEQLRATAVETLPVGTGDSQWGHISNAVGVSPPRREWRSWRLEWGLPVGHTYGTVIEYGRAPGSRMPPVNAIAEWIWGKRHIFTEVKTEKQALRLAFPIARHIAKYGFSTAPDGEGKGWGSFRKAQDAFKAEQDAWLDDLRRRITERIDAVKGT